MISHQQNWNLCDTCRSYKIRSVDSVSVGIIKLRKMGNIISRKRFDFRKGSSWLYMAARVCSTVRMGVIADIKKHTVTHREIEFLSKWNKKCHFKNTFSWLLWCIYTLFVISERCVRFHIVRNAKQTTIR